MAKKNRRDSNPRLDESTSRESGIRIAASVLVLMYRSRGNFQPRSDLSSKEKWIRADFDFTYLKNGQTCQTRFFRFFNFWRDGQHRSLFLSRRLIDGGGLVAAAAAAAGPAAPAAASPKSISNIHFVVWRSNSS